MKKIKSKRVVRTILIFGIFTVILLIGLYINLILVVDPIVYWLASTEGARLFIAFVLSWFIISKLFDLYYQKYKKRLKDRNFNALNVPYPRKFKGRK